MSADDVGDTGRGPEIVVRDHAHQGPDLIQPKGLPVAAEPVRDRVDGQAVVRRWGGGDVAAEERRTDDDVWLWGLKNGEKCGGLGVGDAVVVRVSRGVQFERELSGRRHTEERDASVERIQRRRSHGDAARNVGKQRTYKGAVERVFEERYVCRTWARELGVYNHRQEGGGELCEKVVHEIGVLAAINNVEIVFQHHVVVRHGFLRLALTCICGTRGRASFLGRRGICYR